MQTLVPIPGPVESGRLEAESLLGSPIRASEKPPVTPFFRRFAVALVLAVAVYGAFVIYTGYRQLRGAIADFEWATFGIALSLASFNYLLRFAKWEFYLARLDVRGIPKGESLLVFLSGFVLTVTPGKIGEVFKSAVLWRTHGVPAARTAPIVVAERLTDVMAMVLLIALGSLGFSGGALWALIGAAAVIFGLVLILWRRPLDVLFALMRSRGGRLAALLPHMETARASLLLVAAPSALVLPTLLSFVGWGAEGWALHFLLKGFGEATSEFLALFFYATSTLAGALVPVPGGVGVAETMMQSQLVELGHVAPGAATGAMILIRFATLWWAVLVGFAALSILRAKFSSLSSAVDETIEGDPPPEEKDPAQV